MPLSIKVGARGSKLSQAQVKELSGLLPHIELDPVWITTTGDEDLKTSLRTLDKTDFFTKEIDERLLNREFQIAVHSAKDLPRQIKKGLKIVAITEGVDASDVIVINTDSLPNGARIGTSSSRRDARLKKWRPDFQCIDIRGTIEARLALLDEGKLEGVVIAKAALIRLGLTDRKTIPLPGYTTPLQGKLAVVARADDVDMTNLFVPLDTREILYLGTEPKEGSVHFPVLHLKPRPIPASILHHLLTFTHYIFTSKNAVSFFFRQMKAKLDQKYIIALGKKTAEALAREGVVVTATAVEEQQEGVVNLLRSLDLKDANIFYPRSSIAREHLEQFLKQENICHTVVDLYDTTTNVVEPLFDLHEFKEIIFTSPSTVEAFIEIFGPLPFDKQLTAIGPITLKTLQRAQE